MTNLPLKKCDIQERCLLTLSSFDKPVSTNKKFQQDHVASSYGSKLKLYFFKQCDEMIIHLNLQAGEKLGSLLLLGICLETRLPTSRAVLMFWGALRSGTVFMVSQQATVCILVLHEGYQSIPMLHRGLA